MTWRENMSPSPTTTILLTLIALLNIYLVLASFQNNGMIRLREMPDDYFTVTLNAQISRDNTAITNSFTWPYVAAEPSANPSPKNLDRTLQQFENVLETSQQLENVLETSQKLQNLLEMGSEENRTVVLLVSDYRSGSSLLGEMFNQNDDVFYLFEPLLGVVGPRAQKRFLERLLSCNPLHWGFLRRSRQSGCGEFTEETPDYRNCLKNTNRTAECLKYGITVAKFIRLRGIESIQDFGILDKPNVFVVHSFRDPRGTINSRLSYDVVNYNGKKIPRDGLTEEIVGNIANSLCWRYYNDSVFGDSLPNKYTRVTYEDVCTDPETNIRHVYKMIGHEAPQRVLDWFAQHTHAHSISAKDDKMGLERNSALTAVRWKEELPREFICAIEKNCRQLMDYLQLEYTCSDNNM
ncbi:carbohydrate sulfotransferase 1-like [Bolinopsis microptera]|uniref:carbohydrate sulfotransferase 1-like n=1 Tax=Bolinopsis microptera TaxID=2820187 RepID=UPI003078D39F